MGTAAASFMGKGSVRDLLDAWRRLPQIFLWYFGFAILVPVVFFAFYEAVQFVRYVASHIRGNAALDGTFFAWLLVGIVLAMTIETALARLFAIRVVTFEKWSATAAASFVVFGHGAEDQSIWASSGFQGLVLGVLFWAIVSQWKKSDLDSERAAKSGGDPRG